jgi:hypothetical protein
VGTNYYVRPLDGDGGRGLETDEEGIHLGKSSAGWAFMFRAYPNAVPPVADFASWMTLLDIGEVYDEYGDAVPRADLLAKIEAKRDGHTCPQRRDFTDADGNVFIPEYFS